MEFWVRGVADDEAAVGPQDGECHLPLPYRLPPDPYEGDDTPWMVGEPWPGMDSQGRRIYDPPPSHYGHIES